MKPLEVEKDDIRHVVRQRYGRLVEANPLTGSCCTTTCCERSGDMADSYAQKLGYRVEDLEAAPRWVWDAAIPKPLPR